MGRGQMAFTKFIIVVDEDVDVHDEQAVLYALYSNCDPQRDTETVRGPVDILDHAAPIKGVGTKMGFDATKKMEGEGEHRKFPAKLEWDAATKELVDRRWKEYGFLKGPSPSLATSEVANDNLLSRRGVGCTFRTSPAKNDGGDYPCFFFSLSSSSVM